MCVFHTIPCLQLCKYVLYKVEKVTSTEISVGVEGAKTLATGLE